MALTHGATGVPHNGLETSQDWTLMQMRVALPFLAVSSTPIKSSLSATSSYCKNVQSHETLEKQHRTNMSNNGAGCSAGNIRLATQRMAALSNVRLPWQQRALRLTLTLNGSPSLQLKLCVRCVQGWSCWGDHWPALWAICCCTTWSSCSKSCSWCPRTHPWFPLPRSSHWPTETGRRI